jgi:hypothetical protein
VSSNDSHDTGSRGLPPIRELQLTQGPKTVEEYWNNGLLAREVSYEDRAGLDAFFRERNEAITQGKWEVLRAQEDYPILVVTNTTTGEAVYDLWDEGRNGEVMGQAAPYFPRTELIHEDRQYLFLSNDLVISYETNSYVLDGRRVSWKAANLLVKREGKWRNKAILEGGFGDFLRLRGLVKPPRVGGG